MEAPFATPNPQPHFFKRPASLPTHRVGKIGKLYLPAMALIGLGFGIANHYMNQSEPRRHHYQIEEEERIKENQKLMDAYGDKDSLSDVQHALEIYEVQ